MDFILLWTNKSCNPVIYIVVIMLTVNFNIVVYVYSCDYVSICVFKSLHKRTNIHLTRKVSDTERVLLIYKVAYSQLTHFRTHFCWMIRGRGLSLHPEEEICFAISKPVQRKWISGICSMVMNNEEHYHVLGIMWPVWSWTSWSWFVPTWKTVCTGATHTQYRSCSNSMCVQEPPTHNTGAVACYVCTGATHAQYRSCSMLCVYRSHPCTIQEL
jgi:hypothetical protein